jgi:hypothetical protein
MRIVDPKGVWYVNNGVFRMHDPESKTVFEPAELTKATATTWIKSQPTMAECPDPTAETKVDTKAVAKK